MIHYANLTRRFVLHGFGSCVGLAIVAVLHTLELVKGPLLLVALMMLSIAAYEQPGVQIWLSGGDLRRRLWLRVSLHMGGTTVVLYSLGWGALLNAVYIGKLSMYLGQSGSAAWRPAATMGAIGIGVGQTAIALGWTHSYIPQPSVHGVALAIAFCTVLIAWLLGRSAEDRERAERALLEQEERFRALVQESSDVTTVCNERGQLTYVSPAIERAMGYVPDMLRSSDYYTLVHADDVSDARFAHSNVIGSGTEHRTELRIQHRDGTSRWYEVALRNLLGNPAVQGVVANHRDITERREVQDLLAYDASHDPLTGLSNRSAFLRDLDDTSDRAALEHSRVSVMFLDLDRFKHINDTLGHDAGDSLLVAAAALIRRAASDAVAVGRLGGDEFGILLADVGQPQHAVSVAKRITAEMSKPISLNGHEVQVGASIGISVSEPGRGDPASLLRGADEAMYVAKREGKARWHLNPGEDAPEGREPRLHASRATA